jgi:glycosyltransferase involved in cell wall biosynthesis
VTTVSVIVTTRNAARTLERCLSSIAAQTYPHVECVLVDNASSDQTVAIARRFGCTVLDFGPERSAQRNEGARRSTGALLLFVDADMVLAPGVVAGCVRVMDSCSAPAAIIPEVSFGDGFWTRCRALERHCYSGDDSVEAARLYRREAFVAVGGFDEQLTGAEDWDLSRRVAGARALPRIASVIEHDEGRITLRQTFAKRSYYAPGYLRYLRKHGRDVAGQGNVVLRPAPLRQRRLLARHPLLCAGIVVMKTAEAAAVVSVAARSSALRRNAPGGT